MAFGVDTMVITTANGRFVYDIEVATTPQQQARGLMYRTSLGVTKACCSSFRANRCRPSGWPTP